MAPTDEVLEGIRQFEAAENGLSGIDLNNTYITNTADIKTRFAIPPGLASKTFKPGKVLPVLLIIAALLLATCLLIPSIYSKQPSKSGIIVSLFFIAAIFLSYTSTQQRNARLRYTITISPEGIAYNADFYNWDSIQETALLSLPAGRHTKACLVLVFKNDRGHDTWDISFFEGAAFSSKLCAYIEYFKAMKQNN